MILAAERKEHSVGSCEAGPGGRWAIPHRFLRGLLLPRTTGLETGGLPLLLGRLERRAPLTLLVLRRRELGRLEALGRLLAALRDERRALSESERATTRRKKVSTLHRILLLPIIQHK